MQAHDSSSSPRRRRLNRILLLCRKDLIALHYMYWIIFVCYLALVTGVAIALKSTLVMEIMPALVIMGLYAAEVRLPTDVLVASMPVSRADIVLARYLLAMAILVIATFAMLGNVYVQHLANPGVYTDWVYINNIWSGLYLFLLNSLVVVVAFPLRFCFGIPAGLVAGYLLVFAHLPIMILLERIFENLNADLGRMLRLADSQTSLFGYSVFLIRRTADRFGAIFPIVLAITVVALFAVSIGTAISGYKRKELS